MDDNNKYKILYVDDEDSNLRIFRTGFKRQFDITAANSAKEGLEILAKEEFAIVITDQKMPQMTGTEFLKEVNELYPDTIRVILTGFSDIGAVIDAINHGNVFKYIPKPWNKADMKEAIDECLSEYDKYATQRTKLNELQKQIDEKDKVIAELSSK
jgi:DNA-binding NtrC family response regulator